MKKITFEHQNENEKNTALWLTYRAEYFDYSYDITTYDNFYAIDISHFEDIFRNSFTSEKPVHLTLDLASLSKQNFIDAVENTIDLIDKFLKKSDINFFKQDPRIIDYILYHFLDEENIPNGKHSMFCYNTYTEEVALHKRYQNLLDKYDIDIKTID